MYKMADRFSGAEIDDAAAAAATMTTNGGGARVRALYGHLLRATTADSGGPYAISTFPQQTTQTARCSGWRRDDGGRQAAGIALTYRAKTYSRQKLDNRSDRTPLRCGARARVWRDDGAAQAFSHIKQKSRMPYRNADDRGGREFRRERAASLLTRAVNLPSSRHAKRTLKRRCFQNNRRASGDRQRALINGGHGGDRVNKRSRRAA